MDQEIGNIREALCNILERAQTASGLLPVQGPMRAVRIYVEYICQQAASTLCLLGKFESARPVWTNKPPTEEGFYWIRGPGGNPHLVEVSARSFGDDTLVVRGISRGISAEVTPLYECSPLWEWLLIQKPPTDQGVFCAEE